MKKILIIEDDTGIIEALQAILEFEGFTTHLVRNSQNIHSTVHTIRPDLIILDYLFKGKNGDEITRELKCDETTCKIPILIISAHPSAQSITKKAGADGFLAKPFEFNDLLSLIRQYI